MRVRSYSGAGVFLIREKNGGYEVLLGKRSVKRGLGKWSIPGGGKELRDCTFRDCAFRELKEETGINLDHAKHKVLGRCSKSVPFFHWQTYFVLLKENDPRLVPHEFFQLVWVPLEEVNAYDLWISLGQEQRCLRKLLKKPEVN